ncbi:hypothetical protein T484DRAFT_1879484, partial [Baffinella frigidus]
EWSHTVWNWAGCVPGVSVPSACWDQGSRAVWGGHRGARRHGAAHGRAGCIPSRADGPLSRRRAVARRGIVPRGSALPTHQWLQWRQWIQWFQWLPRPSASAPPRRDAHAGHTIVTAHGGHPTARRCRPSTPWGRCDCCAYEGRGGGGWGAF